MRSMNRMTGYMPRHPNLGHPLEGLGCLPISDAARWDTISTEPGESDAWLRDLRKLAAMLSAPVEPAGALDELRRYCNELERSNDELRSRFDALEATVGWLRGLAERGASDRFASLCETWKRETRLVSNVTKKAIHPAYQQIIAMGYAAVPLILRDLAENGPEDWFWALTAITGENPITEEIAGKMEAMTEAWIEWGVKKGFLNDSTRTTKKRSPDLFVSDTE